MVKKFPSEGIRDRARTLRREMTEAEKRLWQILRSRQTEGCRFRRQVPIGAFIADFVCHEARLIVEIDGGQHDPAAAEERSHTRFLEVEGYRVLRFWNNEVLQNPEGVRQAIAEHLDRATRRVTATNLHQVTPTQTLPHRGGGLEATPKEVADPEAEIGQLREELSEARAQHAAATEILQLINASPGDLMPVFDAILEKALGLCGAAFGQLWTHDGDAYYLVASRGLPASAEEFLRGPQRPGPKTVHGRILAGEHLVHIADLAADEAYRSGDPHRQNTVDSAGARSLLAVSLRRNESLLGVLAIYRQEVRPFTEKEIGVIENFAAQAVIAMENARLLTETREALEQQTATAEVLQVINASPGNLAPVFDAMLERALRLCEGAFGSLFTYEDGLFHQAATRNRKVSVDRPFKPSPQSAGGRLVRGERFVHIVDARDDEAYRSGDPIRVRLVDGEGARSYLAVPMRKGEALLGTITIHREEVRPFSGKQIALLENFAAQAVIAMENARLLTETREALAQQTATAEVLQVINSSPGDLAPVFDAMLEKATRLCGAKYGQLATYRADGFRGVAAVGLPMESADALSRIGHPPPETVLGLVERTKQTAQMADIAREPSYEAVFRINPWLRRVHTALVVPLLKDGELVGTIHAFREEVRPFTDKEIALLQNFAAQAVIAMENARLLNELRERTRDLQESLEYQTAVSDVLKVISGSVFDLEPVLQSLVATAIRLCRADQAVIYRNLDGEYRWAAGHSLLPEYERIEREVRIRPGAGTLVGRAALEARTVHVLDALADPLYEAKDDARIGHIHTMLGVPLLREGMPIGVIGLARQRVEAFSEREIQLVTTFADQAVIAIENARLLGDLQQRTRDLQESLEYQTATSDVLKVISQSGAELEPVLQTLVETAARICEADKAVLQQLRGGSYRMVASFGFTQEFKDYRARNPITPDRGTPIGRMTLDRRVVHIEDALSDPEFTDFESQRLGEFRTMLGVPLFREDTIVGGLFLARSRVEPFSEKQIALVRTFADQAVIAIENARLVGELRERQAELRVTFDNMADGVAMFDASLRLAAWNRNFQQLLQLPDEYLAEPHGFDEYIRYLAARGEFGAVDPEAEIARLRARVGDHYSFERTRPDGTVIEVRHNPMPDGGIVLIYGDITERKRSEEEIRAARDAAEAAYHELKTTQASLIHAEKMASLGQLTAGIAHEIKNPLNFVNNFASLSGELLDEVKEIAAPALAALDKERRADLDDVMAMLSGNLDKIAEHGRRADNIVKSMLEHSRGGSGERRTVDLNGLIDEALNLAYHGARAQDQSFNVTLERDFDPSLAPIEIVPQDMMRVFINLFGNGFYAASKRQREGGESGFAPVLKVATGDHGDLVEIRVRDNGVGIAPEIRDKLFQPFFTTKPTGEGTGLGLSISYDIVTQEHGGAIEVDSREGEFTEFTIRLPRGGAVASAAQAAAN
jgi:GAF domain-containing protein/very-short-patch-repair endonuclease